MTAELTHTTVRGVDPALWRALKVEAARQGKTRGELLNEILQAALDRDAPANSATGYGLSPLAQAAAAQSHEAVAAALIERYDSDFLQRSGTLPVLEALPAERAAK